MSISMHMHNSISTVFLDWTVLSYRQTASKLIRGYFQFDWKTDSENHLRKISIKKLKKDVRIVKLRTGLRNVCTRLTILYNLLLNDVKVERSFYALACLVICIDSVKIPIFWDSDVWRGFASPNFWNLEFI